MEDFILRVKCPVCLKKDGEENTKDNLIPNILDTYDYIFKYYNVK